MAWPADPIPCSPTAGRSADPGWFARSPSTVPAWAVFTALRRAHPALHRRTDIRTVARTPASAWVWFSVRLGGSKPGNHARRRTLAISPLAPAKRGDHLELVVHPADPVELPIALSTTAVPVQERRQRRVGPPRSSLARKYRDPMDLHPFTLSCMHESLLAGRTTAGAAGPRCMNECIVSFILSVLPSCIHSRNRSCCHA